jgi:hypothetical protein
MRVLSDAVTAGKGWVLAASGGTLLALGVILVLWMGRCSPTPGPKIDPKTQHSLDSLALTAQQFKAQRDSLLLHVKHDTILSITYQHDAAVANQAAERSRANAVAAGKRADALAQEAAAARTAADSATKYHAALDERTRERDTLLVTVTQKDSAYRAQLAATAKEHSAFVNLSTAYGADTSRRVALERVNAGLVADIARLQQPCKLIGPVPCPSRTVTGLLSAGLGYLAGRKGP